MSVTLVCVRQSIKEFFIDGSGLRMCVCRGGGGVGGITACCHLLKSADLSAYVALATGAIQNLH